MNNSLLLIFGLSLISFGLSAQVSVAFVGISHDSPDDFSFVAVNDIPANTTIYFTDEEYRNACSKFQFDNTCAGVGEDYLAYTSPGSVVISGTVIVIQETSSNVLNVISGPGSVVRGGLANYSQSSSDVLHAFLASNPADPFNSVTTVLASFNKDTFDGSITYGDNPIGDHPAAIVMEDTGSALSENADYMASLRSMPTSIADLINPAKYTTSTNNFTLSTTDFSSTILPVELISFTAHAKDISVMLKWQTASEESNDYFQVERSTDGSIFKTLDRISGNGTRDELSDYDYLDEKPISGYNYYRLKQVDFNGNFEYSKIVVVLFNEDVVRVDISPNPFTKQVFITLPTIEEYGMVATIVQVSNIYGQVVYQETLTSTRNYPLDLSKLAIGNYILQIKQAGNSIATKRLIKL